MDPGLRTTPGHLPQNVAETARVTRRFPDRYNGPQCIPVEIVRNLLDPHSPLDIDMASPGELPLEILSPPDAEICLQSSTYALLNVLNRGAQYEVLGLVVTRTQVAPVNAPLRGDCCMGFSCTQQHA